MEGRAAKKYQKESQFNIDADSSKTSNLLTAARIWFSPPLQETMR